MFIPEKEGHDWFSQLNYGNYRILVYVSEGNFLDNNNLFIF